MKDFDEFLTYAATNERACQVAAEQSIEGTDYYNEDGTFKPEDLLNAAYTTGRASTLALMRQYHEWLNA